MIMNGLGKGLGALISTEGMSSAARPNLKRELKAKEKKLEDLKAEIEERKKQVEGLRKDLTIQLMLEGKADKRKLFEMEEELKLCFDEKEMIEIEIENLLGEMESDFEPGKNGDKDGGKEIVETELRRSQEIDMGVVKDLMFGLDDSPEKTKNMEEETEGSDEDHIDDLIKELDQSRQAEEVRKEAYGEDKTPPAPEQQPSPGPESTSPPSPDDIQSPSDTGPAVSRKVKPGKVRIIRKKKESQGKDDRLYGYIKEAQEHLSRRDSGEAKAILHKALREYPLDDELLYHLGNAFFLEGDLDQAEIRFRKSTEANPKSFRAFNNLGVVLRKKGEREAAIQAFNQSLEYNDDYERAWLNLGNIFMEIDPPMLKEARIFLRRALECDPDLAQAKEKLEECERLLSSDT
jgi:tetratricopeptide (TPR) repeat protein